MKTRDGVILLADLRRPVTIQEGLLMTRDQPVILVVDDDSDSCQNMSDILSDHGYRVDIAYDARSALRLVEANRYDIALLDLRMPSMDGLSLCCEVTRRHPKTVALLITGYPEDVHPARALAAGVRLTFPKPVHVGRLLAEIKQTLAG